MAREVFNNIDEYIESFPSNVKLILYELKEAIKEVAPQATEKISWSMPTFYYNGNLVHFAAFKNHIGFYPGDDGVRQFLEQLSEYKTSKGAIQFPINKPLPLKLIQDIVKYRVLVNTKNK